MKRIRIACSKGLLVLAVAMLMVLDGGLARAIEVGEKIPHQLSVQDQSGTMRDFASLKRGKGMILLFTRSLDW